MMRRLLTLALFTLPALGLWWLLGGASLENEDTPPVLSLTLGEAPSAARDASLRDLTAGDSPTLDGRGAEPAPLPKAKPLRRWPLSTESVHAQVVDARGKGVPGIAVDLIARGWGEATTTPRSPAKEPRTYVHATATTNATGGCMFDRLYNAGQFSLAPRVRSPWSPMRVRVGGSSSRRDETLRVQLVLERGTPLRVQVVDQDGAGVLARVTATRLSYARSVRMEKAPHLAPRWTSNAGIISFKSVPPGPLRLHVFAPGVGTRTVTTEADATNEFVVKLAGQTPHVITGRVMDPAGTPIPGATVGVQMRVEVSAPIGFASDHEVTTDDEGRYRITQAFGCSVAHMTARAIGFADRGSVARGARIQPGQPLDINICMTPVAALHGMVRDVEGRPLEGARVHIKKDRRHPFAGDFRSVVVFSDAEGRFAHEGLFPGRYVVTGKRDGFQESPWQQVRAHVTQMEPLDIMLAAAGTIEGTVRTADGQPSVSARVRVRVLMPGKDPNYKDLYSSLTDDEGRYSVSGFPADGSWQVYVTAPSGWAEPLTTPAMRARESRTLDIDLHAGRTFSGTVRTQDGKPVPGIVIALKRSGRSTLSDNTGSFSFKGLRPGRHDVIARVVALKSTHGSSYLYTISREVTAARDPTPVTLVLPHYGTVRGRVVDSEGQPVADAPVYVEPTAPGLVARQFVRTGPQGSFVIQGLPDVPYRAWVYRFPGGARAPIEVDGPVFDLVHNTAVARPELRERQPAPIVVHATLPSGLPVVHATVRVSDPTSGRTLTMGAVRDGRWHGTQMTSWPPRVRVTVSDPRALDGRRANALTASTETAVPVAGPVMLQLAPGQSISGSVVMKARGRLGRHDGWLTVSRPRRPNQPRPETLYAEFDEDLRFEVCGLGPGEWIVRYDLTERGPLLNPPPQVVAAGGPHLELRVEHGATIRGYIEGPTRGGFAEAEVAWRNAESKVGGWTKSRSDGTFEIVGLPHGAQGVLSATVPGQVNRDVYVERTLTDVETGSSRHVLRVLHASPIFGVLKPGQEGIPIPHRCDVTAWRMRADGTKGKKYYQATAIRGRFRLAGLPDGAYIVEARAGKGIHGRVDGVRTGAKDLVVHVDKQE